MIENLVRLYIYESLTLITLIIAALFSSILNLKIVLSVDFIFMLLVFVVWVFTSRIILKFIIEEHNNEGEDNSAK